MLFPADQKTTTDCYFEEKDLYFLSSVRSNTLSHQTFWLWHNSLLAPFLLKSLVFHKEQMKKVTLFHLVSNSCNMVDTNSTKKLL